MDLQRYFNLLESKVSPQDSPELLEKHLKETGGKIVTRMPPEPNFLMHLGHAKAAFVNFQFAKMNGGYCYMRFDDTNPTKEKQDYIDSMLEDIKWLGHEAYKVTYTSDYFEELYNYAIELIKMDKAYVCELDQDTMQKQRYDMIDSPYRNRPIEESLDLFRRMRAGEFENNKMTLRLKCDMQSPNPNMRDVVAYRILHAEHHRTGNKFCIYPGYDYSHPIVDSIENITHSLCSTEFQVRNELYRWVPTTLKIYRAPQIEYGKLSVTNTVLSKRKLVELINNKIITDLDDPRLPTLKGLKRRGYTPEAINDFCYRIGLSLGNTASVSVNYRLLEECIRQDLNTKAPRLMAVLYPITIHIINLPDSYKQTIQVKDFPDDDLNTNSHEITLSNKVYIERDDFRLEDSPQYFRLAPGKIVRLKYAGLIKCVNVVERNGVIHRIEVELLPQDYKPEKRVKGTISWVDAKNGVPLEIRKYDHLFPEKLEKTTGDWKDQLNKDSVKILSSVTSHTIISAKPYDRFQFERIGYFVVDPDTLDQKIVLNMITSLKEDKNK
ncbi:glutaminyl-tRNA synthetase [Klosneuvirus KNV1]|uniref:glutamine--tRNA ligase n=1 Tax=Klosneuvirus KNV1 TaxID=1977640 RepID=A0A1V0SK72_9VIRU|nr:glutaminyl-tRNA synthetase [Klosneuvirus KNV1]